MNFNVPTYPLDLSSNSPECGRRHHSFVVGKVSAQHIHVMVHTVTWIFKKVKNVVLRICFFFKSFVSKHYGN